MQRTLTAGAAALCLAMTGGGVAVAARTAPAPKSATVKAVSKGAKFKINRYVLDPLRWNKDVYHVRSGGTITVVNNANDGPHTFSVVKKGDLPRTAKQINNCKICETIAQQHGADPSSDAPPQHLWTENTVGQDTAANFDQPGDSAFIPPDPGSKVQFKVTAAKGTTLHFMCAVHPWMQAKVIVG